MAEAEGLENYGSFLSAPNIPMTAPQSSSTQTTVTASLAFDVHFDHAALAVFNTASPEERSAWRKELDEILYGDHEEAVQRLFTGAIGQPTLDADPVYGNLSTKTIETALNDLVTAYNVLQTGIQFSLDGDVPTCVRYEWIDGQRRTIYNYSLASIGGMTGSNRPPSTYHATLIYDLA